MRRLVPIFYRDECRAGARPKNPLHLGYKKNCNRHSSPKSKKKNCVAEACCNNNMSFHSSKLHHGRRPLPPLPPSLPLPRPFRRVESARPILVDAVSARIDSIRATGGVLHNFSFIARIKAEQAPPHTTINRRAIQLATPLPLPLRRLEPAHHIVGDAVSARLGSIRATGGVLHNFLLIA